MKAYKSAYDECILLDELPATLGNAYRNRINVMTRGLPSTDWIPPVLAWYCKFKGEGLLEFIDRIDNKFSADWILQLTPTERIKNMNDVLKLIEVSMTPADVLSAKAFDFDRLHLRSLLDGAMYGRRFARYVLLRLEYVLATHAAPLNIPDEISVEHILPQSIEKLSQWGRDFTEAQHEYWLHRLGNLMLLSRRKNSKLSNFDFPEKKSRYIDDHVESLPNSQRILALSTFGTHELESRHKDLLARLVTSYERKS